MANYVCMLDRHLYWVNIRLFEYNILSVQTHNIRIICLTASCCNNIVFVWVAKTGTAYDSKNGFSKKDGKERFDNSANYK